MFGTLRRIARFWRPHRWLAVGLALSMLLQVVFTVVLAYCLKLIVDGIVDEAAGRPAATSATFIVILLVLALLVSAGAAAIGAKLAARASANILADVRSQMFDRLQDLSMDFYGRTQEGDLLAHFSSDVAQLSAGIINRPLEGLRSGVSLLFYFPFMLMLDPRLAIPAFIATPIAVFLVTRVAPDADSALDDEKRSIGRVIDVVAENIRSQRVIRAFGSVGRSRAQFLGSIAALRDASNRAEFRIAMVSVLSEYSISIVQLLIVAIGALMAFGGSLEAGTFAAFVALLTEFTWEATVIGSNVLPEIRKAASGIRRVDGLLNAGPVVAAEANLGDVPALETGIRFDDVTFSYADEVGHQLERVTLDIPAGATVAIVGPSGSGKSTLLNLLLRFYEPDTGTLSVDGRDLRTVDMAAWRASCGVVFQDTFLFNQTLRDNILIGSPDADASKLSDAVEAAGLSSLVARLQSGLDTPVGPNGRQVSGGERQRIGLARALVREPRLLLLDEVTSALDPATEAEVNRAVASMAIGRTVITVTHRLQTVTEADFIIAMEGGRIVETGTFTGLLASGGLLASMWEKQQGFRVAADGRSASIAPMRLRGLPMFAHLDEVQLAQLAAEFTAHFFDIDDVVFEQGESAARFYVIVRGVAEVIHHDSSGEQVIAHLEDGDFFGEMALLDDSVRNATVKAVTPTTTLSLERHEFDALLQRWPEAADAIRSTAAARAEQNRLDPPG